MNYVQCSGYYVCKQVTASAVLLIDQKHVYSAFFNFTKKRDEKSARFVIRSFVNRSQISHRGGWTAARVGSWSKFRFASFDFTVQNNCSCRSSFFDWFCHLIGCLSSDWLN